ncbi:glycosyltransferase [Actinomadura sp. J1-007]|nr:glycosyltransferase family 2 protein [Actinomadura sp. J1-007]MWK36129.1 glycosyltransferase [Actinomadura sp. J1-007]
MDSPKVSVIVPVYNCRASVEGTLRSVFEQTLGAERVEVVAVDDGSTDGSGEELDRLAAVHDGLRVVHQANSGGPGGPRNTAVRLARGEYLFFLDADDRLGPEALERMCAMADEQGTDIVIGNYVGVGRGVARFGATVPRVSVDDPDFDVYGRSLTAHKLFRRDLVTGNGITFPRASCRARTRCSPRTPCCTRRASRSSPTTTATTWWNATTARASCSPAARPPGRTSPRPPGRSSRTWCRTASRARSATGCSSGTSSATCCTASTAGSSRRPRRPRRRPRAPSGRCATTT